MILCRSNVAEFGKRRRIFTDLEEFYFSKCMYICRVTSKTSKMENNSNIASLTADDNVVSVYMRLLNHLSIEAKLKLIAKLTESLSVDFKEKTSSTVEKKSWKSLAGAWKDMPDDLEDQIRASRVSKSEVPNFDDV